jgi:hypothetical protein
MHPSGVVCGFDGYQGEPSLEIAQVKSLATTAACIGFLQKVRTIDDGTDNHDGCRFRFAVGCSNRLDDDEARTGWSDGRCQNEGLDPKVKRNRVQMGENATKRGLCAGRLRNSPQRFLTGSADMKWEYRVEEIDLVAIPDAESFLNDIGGEGWELVSVALSVGGVTSHNIAFFKRPARD